MSSPLQPGGRGPLGVGANSPTSDAGTMARTQHQPSAPKGAGAWNAIKEDPLLAYGAWYFKGAREAASLIRGDKQGRQLMELWMSGAAPDEVTFDDEEWGDYMRSEPDLQKQIASRLEADAYGLRDRVNASTGKSADKYESSFHGEVGKKSPLGKDISGGYFTGYELLHGSKKTVGEVQIAGKFTALRSGDAKSAYTVTFDDLCFVWNDIINPNPTYSGDRVFLNYARSENHFTGGPPPKDYTIHIKWKAKQSTIIKVVAEGEVPPGLKTFLNR